MAQPRHSLERSTLEAYAGIGIAIITVVFPLTWWGKSLLLLVLALILVDLSWRSKQTVNLKPIHKLAFSILSVGLLTGLSYKPLLEQYHQESDDIPEDLAYLRSWGVFSHFTVRRGPPLSVDGNASTTLVVNGEMLTKYKYRRKLIGICFHHWAGANFRDEQGISKSAAYDIDSTSIEIVIPLNEVFIAEELRNPASASYVLLAVPFRVKPEDFNSIRDAESLGAEIIARASAHENLINN